MTGEGVRYLGEPAEFAGQVALMGDHVAFDRVRVGRHALSPPVQGSANISGFDGDRAAPVGESDGVGLVAAPEVREKIAPGTVVCRPDDVYTDPAVVARTHEIIRHHGSSPLIAQPSREQLTTALTM